MPSVGHTSLEDDSTSTSNGDAGDEEGYIENYTETSVFGSHQADGAEALEDGADQVGIALWCARQQFHGWDTIVVWCSRLDASQHASGNCHWILW